MASANGDRLQIAKVN